MAEIKYSKILDDTASFQLVRTNPKLTGNVKFTVDSFDNMWLNTIDANEELAKDQYKRVAIDPTKSLSANMYRLLNSGQTPREIVFDLKESFEADRTSTDFKDQYDFSNYFSGAKYLVSRRYSEKLSYFAPLYLKKEVPDYFIVLKIKDPINKKIDRLEEEYPYDRESYMRETFKNSKIIKTFNLKKGTKVGDYLRNYVNSESFPPSSLNVSYQEGNLTYWNGILYDSGVIGSRGENLYEFYQQSNPIKFFEEFITGGFERNGVIYPNILNMEFIFDDPTEPDLYDFDRYIGFYVNAIELTKLDIDLDRMYDERGSWENTPRLRRETFEWEQIQVTQSNLNGTIVPVKNSNIYFSDLEDSFSDKENLFFNYLIDKFDQLHLLKLDSSWEIDYSPASLELKSAKLRLADTKIDFGNLFGPYQVFVQDKANSTQIRGFSTQHLKIDQFNHLDEIKIYHPLGTKSDLNGKFDLVRAAFSYSEVPNPGDAYIYNDIDGVIGEDIFYFNPTGLVKEKTSAIATCINAIRNLPLKAYAINEYIFIKANSPGEFDSSFKIEFRSPLNVYSNITIGGITGNNLIGNLINFEGGSRESGNRLILSNDNYTRIKENLDNILVKTVEGWSKIRKISRYQDTISEKNTLTELSRTEVISDYFSKMVITLDLDVEPQITYAECSIFRKYQPGLGLISFFPIKDFDFDFYSSEYLNFPVIDLYKDYFIPPEVKLLDHNYTYEIIGDGQISINGVTYSTGTPIILAPSTEKYSYSILSGDVYVSYLNDTSTPGARLDVAINDQNRELQEFPGFFLLKDPDLVVPEQQGRFFELRKKYLNGLASNEYDYYKENYNTDFALRSKMLPYITKWIISNGKDSRDNFYRLNSELVFGFNNFSPDHEDRSQNPDNFTHEWFYIESNFNYLEDQSTVFLNNSYFDQPFDLNRALTEKDYFVNYFTYTPTFNGSEVGRTQFRYSPINKDFLNEFSCFFKGFKINFKEYIDPNNLDNAGIPIPNPNSTRFKDYRFTSLLKLVKEEINDDTKPPLKYRFIEHKDFKFVILLIELNIGDISKVDDYWKEVQSAPTTTSPVDRNNYLNSDPNLSSAYVFDSINGEYRIKFKTIDGIDISDITHLSLYSLKNKKFNNLLDNYSNIRLSQKINLSASGAFTSGGNDIEGLSNLNFLNYDSRISDEFKRFTDSTFLIGRNNFLNVDQFLDFAPGLIPQNTSKIISASLKSISLSTNSDLALVDELGVPAFTIPAAVPASYFRNNYTFKIMTGGKLYFESLFQKLSFGEFKKLTNSLNPFIEYSSYSLNGSTLTQDSDVNWYINIPNYSNITKVDAIIAQPDANKPSNFSFSSLVGFSYQRSQLDNPYEINRYEGGFSPLFKDVSAFKSNQIFISNSISDLENANTRFNLELPDFLKIINFNHIKISDNKILDLESDQIFEPKYELVNEIAIGRADYDLLQSNWDFGFHYKYSDKSTKKAVPGTLRIEEDDSFISKLINLRDEIELENYSTQIFTDLNQINLDDIELAYVDNPREIEGYINIKNVLTSFLISDGISEKFNEFLVNSVDYIGNNNSIESYIVQYIKLNIIKLYNINGVELYTKSIGNTSTETGNPNTIEFEFLNDQQRNDLGYTLNRNLQINKTDRFILKFKFNKNFNNGLSISPKVKIKLI
jgi:hypothetical protein